jgi:hypothetical protein
MGYSIDGANKLISLTGGTTSFSVRDLWSRWIDWLLTSDNSKYTIAMDVVGGNEIDSIEGTFIPIYLFLQNGWKIKPQESSHTLKVTDGILIDGSGGDPFVNTVGSYVVRINYQQPVQAISFDAGGGASSIPQGDKDDIVNAVLAGEIDANIVKVNGIGINGAGTENNPWGP